MNTPDTEWETQVCKACGGDGFTVEYDPRDQTGNTPMQVQCDYCHAEGEYMTLDEVRSLLSSRDTYWKERVRKEVEGMKSNENTKLVDEGGREFTDDFGFKKAFLLGRNHALDTLLDNLK